MVTAGIAANKTQTGVRNTRHKTLFGTIAAALCLAAVPAIPHAQSLAPTQAPLRFARPVAFYRRGPALVLKTEALNAAADLYNKTTGAALAASDGDLDKSYDFALSQLTHPFSPSVVAEPALLVLFGSQGEFTHLVEQTVVQTAHHKSVSLNPNKLHLKLKAEFVPPGSTTQTAFSNALLVIEKYLNDTQKNSRNPPVDPNLMTGPIRLQADGDAQSALLPREARGICRLPLAGDLYPQPLIYTIKFENLNASGVGPAKMVKIIHQMNPRLDSTKVLPLLITFDDQPGTTLIHRSVVPNSATGNFTFPGSAMQVKLNRTGNQLTWEFHSGTLPPGGQGSVSFLVLPRPAFNPPDTYTIFNEPAMVQFFDVDPGTGPLPPPKSQKMTNAWPM